MRQFLVVLASVLIGSALGFASGWASDAYKFTFTQMDVGVAESIVAGIACGITSIVLTVLSKVAGSVRWLTIVPLSTLLLLALWGVTFTFRFDSLVDVIQIAALGATNGVVFCLVTKLTNGDFSGANRTK